MPAFTIPTFDGQQFSGYLAQPAASIAPGIIVCQEIFGVNAAMRQICDALAQEGYFALCPDLFWRIKPGLELTDKTDAGMQEAFRLFNAFDVEQGIIDLLASLAALRKHPGCNGAVGTVGYCLGGKLAFLMMSRSDVDCGVSYYGVGLENLLSEIPDIRRPLLMHIAENDQYVPAPARERILQSVRRNPQIKAELYPGVEHAFARPDGVHHDAAAARLANERSRAFLTSHLRQ